MKCNPWTNQNAPNSARISAVGSGSVVGFDSIPGDEPADFGVSNSEFDIEAEFDIETEQMRENEAAYSDMQLQAYSDRMQADLDHHIDPGSFDLSGGLDPGGSDSEFDIDSDFDIKAEQMQENEAAYSDMQLQADSDRLQADLDQRIDPGGSDLSGGPDPDGSDSELYDCDQQLHEEDGPGQQVSGDEEGGSGGFDLYGSWYGSDSAGYPFTDQEVYYEEEFDIETEQMRENEAAYSDMQLQEEWDQLQQNADQSGSDSDQEVHSQAEEELFSDDGSFSDYGLY